MSTVLINTQGGSRFQEGTDLVSGGTQLGTDVKKILKKFSVQLTDTDNKPILKPNRKVIDVVNDFSWYAGPTSSEAALNKVPCIFLTEREQLLSSLISGALYYLNATANVITAFKESEYVQSTLNKIQASDATKKAFEGAGSFLDGFQARTSGTDSDRALLSQNNLKSLEGIYFTRPTGFQYRLPIYESPTITTGEWDDSGGDNKISQFIESGMKTVNTISDAVNIAQPGVYIEKPMYFQEPKGRSETVTFPLANTIRRGTVSPIQQNYELLWLLAFQNKPYKTSFGRTPPPKIYSVSVPGQFSMPYAYISEMSVEFQGTIRKSKVYVPTGNGSGSINSKLIETPVPDAYQVSITFSSLIKDYGNAMLGDNFSTSLDGNTVIFGN